MIVVSSLGLTLAAIVVGCGAAAFAALLLWRSWRDTDSHSSDRGDHERRQVVEATALLAGAPLISAGVVRFATGQLSGGELWVPRAISLVLGITAATLFFSSLIDWCYIYPRLKGVGCRERLPCQSSGASEWRTVTKVWLAHRIVAYVAIRVAILGTLGLIVAAFHPRLSTPFLSIAGAAAAAIAVYYVDRLITISTLVSNPPIQVGDKIVLAEEYGTGVDKRPVYYVVDVAIEGVQLRELETGDLPLGGGEKSHDRSLDLRDIGRLLRNRENFEGCDGICLKASKHCRYERGEQLKADPT